MTAYKKPLLSICIPNYNRAELLLENLRAIGTQADQPIEVVVADDCSTVDIATTIKQVHKEFPDLNLNFSINHRNLGFDKNVLNVINQANGKYCWLLSNDDTLIKGSLALIISTIKKNPHTSLFNINYSRFDHLLKKTTASAMVSLKKDRKFQDPNKFFFLPTSNTGSYFKFLGVNTITMSTDIFRRDWWREAVVDNVTHIGHNFIHVFVLADIIKRHPEIYFVAKPLVQYLANNHRTWPNDIWKDYNLFLVNHLINLGYDKKQALRLRRLQRIYEQKEALTKNKILSTPYLNFRRLIGLIRSAFTNS